MNSLNSYAVNSDRIRDLIEWWSAKTGGVVCFGACLLDGLAWVQTNRQRKVFKPSLDSWRLLMLLDSMKQS